MEMEIDLQRIFENFYFLGGNVLSEIISDEKTGNYTEECHEKKSEFVHK